MQSSFSNDGKFGGRLVNHNGEPILFTGMENLTKIEEQFDDAMINLGLGAILGKDDDREPVLCALNTAGTNSRFVNDSKREVAKWEDDCRRVITHYKSILTTEMKAYIRTKSEIKEETSRKKNCELLEVSLLTNLTSRPRRE